MHMVAGSSPFAGALGLIVAMNEHKPLKLWDKGTAEV